jgi:hypothetical protein
MISIHDYIRVRKTLTTYLVNLILVVHWKRLDLLVTDVFFVRNIHADWSNVEQFYIGY